MVGLSGLPAVRPVLVRGLSRDPPVYPILLPFSWSHTRDAPGAVSLYPLQLMHLWAGLELDALHPLQRTPAPSTQPNVQ
jgi:hypothetical protein